MKRFLICAALCSVASFGFATDYYVDSENGNDHASGTTPAAAWQTLQAVNRAELEPGDRVLFKKGGLWRGSLTLSSGAEGKELVYASYGEGEKPRLYGSAALDEESDWIDQGNGLWATRPVEILPVAASEKCAFATGGWGFHTEGGAEASREISGNGLGASIKISCKNSGKAANHLQLINAPFPVERDKVYRLSFYASSTKPFKPGFPSLCMAGSPWSGYGAVKSAALDFTPEPTEQSVVFEVHQTANDGRITFALGGQIPEGAVVALDRFSVTEVKINDPGLKVDVGNIILDGKKAAWKRWTKEDLKNANDFWFDIRGDFRLWFKSEKNPAALFSSIEAANMTHIINHSCANWVIVDGLDLRYGAAHGFGGTKANHLTIRNCDLSWIGGGDQYRGGGEGRRVRFGNAIEFWSDASDCLVENCRIWEVYDAALTNQGSGTNVERNITYRNNEIWNCEYSFEFWNRDETSKTENILFENNVCRDAGYGWGHVQRPDRNGRHFMVYQNSSRTANFVVRNNSFENATESLVRLDACKSNPDWPSKGLTLSGNRYADSEDRPYFYWFGENFKKSDFDRFRAATGME